MASPFLERLRQLSSPRQNRRWRYVPYDQLTDDESADSPADHGLVLVESRAKAARRPYHQQKLALILANQRHFALEQAQRGVAIHYLVTEASFADALTRAVAELGPLEVQRPAERELRHELEPLADAAEIEIVDNPAWLTTDDQFTRACPQGPPWRMDAFYRLVRRESGWLMQDGKPEGGKFSFDAENRKPWRGEPQLPTPPRFEPDAVTREVGDLIANRFADHPGRLDLTSLPATRDDAESMWTWAQRHCLPHFGPYEDAMSIHSTGLFHTRISPLLNIGRLSPRVVVDEVSAMDAPIASREGFVRQVLGWREFVRHVHRATDGLRRLPNDGSAGAAAGGSEPAAPSHLGADRPLPPAYWGSESGLACLDRVVADVWQEAYSHHITRLMVLANLGTLLDVEPRALTDWFWIAYLDAFDWVVEPNVLGMGTYAAGDLMTTKPYVSGAAYIHRMSDYCSACRFDPRRNCPITSFYWAFLARHRERLTGNRRMSLPLASLRKRTRTQQREDRRVFERASGILAAGSRLTPSALRCDGSGR